MKKLKIERGLFWLFTNDFRILMLWAVIVGISFPFARIAQMDWTIHLLLVGGPLVLIRQVVYELGRDFFKIDRAIEAMEDYLQNNNASPALSIFWEMSYNNDHKELYYDFFDQPVYARHFYNRFFTILEKLKEAPVVQFKGIRIFDFTDSLEAVIDYLESEKTEGEISFEQGQVLSEFKKALEWLIENRIKPQESFYIENSDIKTFEAYRESMLWLYHRYVLTYEEQCKKVAEYFDKGTKENFYRVVAAGFTNELIMRDVFDFLQEREPKTLSEVTFLGLDVEFGGSEESE